MKNKDLKEILKPLDDYLKNVDNEINEKLKCGIPIIDESAMHLFSKGGKKIRAALVILTSGLKNDVPDGTIELAAAVEIVHAASLIHDDIIDQSLLRRGNITVPKKWGNKVSVLIGDYMYSVALRSAVNDEISAIFPLLIDGTKDMVMGELYQLQYADLDSIKRERYLKIIELKTARFMGACAKLGATKSKLSEEECEKLYQFGFNLGLAFQIIDDTLDLVDDSSQTGKDTGNDFKDGKITIPFIFLIEQSNDEDMKMLKNFTLNPDIEKWEIIKKRLVESGAINHSMEFAAQYIEKATTILEEFPESDFRNILFDLSRFFLYRKY